MVAEKKTPGLYVFELSAFPNTMPEVETAIPVFIGYTEKAYKGDASLQLIPVRITSLAEYVDYFGGSPKTIYSINVSPSDEITFPEAQGRFLMYNSLRLFFDNGGMACYVVSVGDYSDVIEKGYKNAAKGLLGGLLPLEKEQEPSLIVVPDAVLLSDRDCYDVYNEILTHCQKTQSRFAILDVHDGYKKRKDPDGDVVEVFRENVDVGLDYGACYYPWINTNVVTEDELDYSNLNEAALQTLRQRLETEADALFDAGSQAEKKKNAYWELLEKLIPDDEKAKRNPDLTTTHMSLLALSPEYRRVMNELRKTMNLMPPSAAMAGVYARTDHNVGVFQAPVNTGLVSVISPAVEIEQEDQNAPLDGKAVNALRSFPGRGVLVRGARTLDGNSQDWRYINVRRTLIMLEQSIKMAMCAYGSERNTERTWHMVQSMISEFLNNQWKAGALAGARPAEAFEVQVGLGSTMTPDDILEGYMRVTVKVAVSRPAEFIMLTFKQKVLT